MIDYMAFIPIIVISSFILLLIKDGILYSINSKKKPKYDDEPSSEDKFVSIVKTFYFSHSRVLNKSFHPDEKSALETAKKNAIWYDKYGNVHRNVGICWEVKPI